jgi:hypothetical protein
MQKLDRLGWAAGISFVSYGARIGVRVNDASALDRLAEHLPPRWQPARSPIVDELFSVIVGGGESGARVRHYNLLYAGAARLARTLDVDELFDLLESNLHLQVAARARSRLFVQAGVVGWRGRAIVIPGRSLSGKTNLVAALVRAGATYYSDEYAVFDARGRVHPYARPLSLREAGRGARRKCAVEVLGGCRGIRPLPVGLIVVTGYKSAARWRPRPLSPAQAALSLLDNTVLARIRPDLALPILREVVRDSTNLKGVRGEADEVVAPLLNQIESLLAT